jgi:hypothetical protein
MRTKRTQKRPGKVAGDTGRSHSGRRLQSGLPGRGEPGRGSSIQGEHQDARGGNAGANQGGAPRGASRLEPSHTRDARRKERRGGPGRSRDSA